MLLLGANDIDEILNFPMITTINTISGTKTVQQYLNEKYYHAIELFGRKDFPKDIYTLKSAFGVLYNYFGLRSICKMYSNDYIEECNNNNFLKHIYIKDYTEINKTMVGWLDSKQIEHSLNMYIRTISPLLRKTL